MPGYLIHLAIVQNYINQKVVKDESSFIKGAILPDLLKRQGFDSHFGSSKSPNFKMFFKQYSNQTDFEKDYFIHLITDYLFYNNVVKSWSKDIYKDYNILSTYLINKYNFSIPKELWEVVKFDVGELKVLTVQDVDDFIYSVSSKPFSYYYKLFG